MLTTPAPPIETDRPCTPAQARQFAGCVTLLTEEHAVSVPKILEAIHATPDEFRDYMDGRETPGIRALGALWKMALARTAGRADR